MAMTNVGFAEIAGLAGNTGSCTAFTYIANGSGSTAAAATQTALVSENSGSGSDRAAATVSRVTTSVTNDTLRLTKTWTISGSITVRELGAFNASSGGTMGSRWVRGSDRSLSSGDSYTGTIDWAFS